MRMMRKMVIASAVLGLCFPSPVLAGESSEVSAAGVTRAVDCGESVTAEILGVLKAAGGIDADAHEASCARLRLVEAARPASVFSAEARRINPSWKFEWKNGFALSRSDQAFKLKFGSRVMLDGGGVALQVWNSAAAMRLSVIS